MAEPIFSWGSFTLSTILSGAAGYFLRPLIDERFAKRSTNWQERRDLADKAIALVAEGDASDYTRFPEHERATRELAMKIGIIDYKMGSELTKYLMLWNISAVLFRDKGNSRRLASEYATNLVAVVQHGAKIVDLAAKLKK